MSLFKTYPQIILLNGPKQILLIYKKTGIRQMIGWKEEVSLEESVITNWPLSHRET